MTQKLHKSHKIPFYAPSKELKNFNIFQIFTNCFKMALFFMFHYDIIITSIHQYISNVTGLHYFKQDYNDYMIDSYAKCDFHATLCNLKIPIIKKELYEIC